MELIPVKERLPERNGRYIVLIQVPAPYTTYIGPFPWTSFLHIYDYIVEPRAVFEKFKVPYWLPNRNEVDYSFFITHWSVLPDIPADYKDHRADKEKAIREYNRIKK